VRRLNRSPILDVGAAEGFLGQLLGEMGASHLELDAIEPNPQWSEKARPFYRELFESTVEDAPLPDNKYQVVVCADVLEHVVNPVSVIERLRQTATPDAHFIISLPNIAHIAIRMMLLAGQFPKMEKGILDRTHLHFYTQKTAREMLESAGLRVERILPTVVPLEIWLGESNGSTMQRRALHTALKRSQYSALHMAPNVFAYQWIFVARPAQQ